MKIPMKIRIPSPHATSRRLRRLLYKPRWYAEKERSTVERITQFIRFKDVRKCVVRLSGPPSRWSAMSSRLRSCQRSRPLSAYVRLGGGWWKSSEGKLTRSHAAGISRWRVSSAAFMATRARVSASSLWLACISCCNLVMIPTQP